MSETAVEQELKPRTFYSRNSGLCVTIAHPKPVLQDGTRILVGGKMAQFVSQGDKYGIYTTNDPEVIAKLEKHPMVLSPEQYNKATTPVELQLKSVEDEKLRLIAENNRLMEMLSQQTKPAEAQKGGAK